MPRRIKYLICYGLKDGSGGKLWYDGKNDHPNITNAIREKHPGMSIEGYGYKPRPKLSKKMKMSIKAIDTMLGGVDTILFGKGSVGISEGVYRNIWLKQTPALEPDQIMGDI